MCSFLHNRVFSMGFRLARSLLLLLHRQQKGKHVFEFDKYISYSDVRTLNLIIIHIQ